MRAVHLYVAMLIVMYCNAMCTKHSHLGLQACCLRALALTVLRVLNSLCLPKTKDGCCSCIVILQCLSVLHLLQLLPLRFFLLLARHLLLLSLSLRRCRYRSVPFAQGVVRLIAVL